MTDKLSPEDYGQIAFDAYGNSTGGLTWDKKPIPEWIELPEHVRKAWIAAAQAVLDMWADQDADPGENVIIPDYNA